jgi:hypothetical protein
VHPVSRHSPDGSPGRSRTWDSASFFAAEQFHSPARFAQGGQHNQRFVAAGREKAGNQHIGIDDRPDYGARITVTVCLDLQQPRLPLGLAVHSRLWFGFAGCEGAAEPPLERRDPFRRPSGRPIVGVRSIRAVVAGSAGAARRAAKSGIRARNERHRCQLVILAREMRAGARPWPVPGMAHQPRDHWIERDVACAAGRCGSSITTAPKRPWNRWPVQPNRALIAPV